MAIINLRDYYPFYTSDYFMEVPEDVVEMFKEFDRKEAAYRLRTYRHKAYYSLDRNDGIEHEALFVAFSPYELYERKVTIAMVFPSNVRTQSAAPSTHSPAPFPMLLFSVMTLFFNVTVFDIRL